MRNVFPINQGYSRLAGAISIALTLYCYASSTFATNVKTPIKSTIQVYTSDSLSNATKKVLSPSTSVDNHSRFTVKSLADASRFLKQAAFGGNRQELERLTNYQDYLEQQFNLPITYLYPKTDPALTDRLNWSGKKIVDKVTGELHKSWTVKDLTNTWWHTIVNSEDQLRQRIAHVLSQIFVVGTVQQTARQDYVRLAYYDLLVKNAFGNYRELLNDVTMSPIMASYLTMINNKKGDPNIGSHPDENFAREVMQLFTIGLEKLNLDGSPLLDQYSQAIPTYIQADIEGLAKVFTGLTYSKEERFQNPDNIRKPLVFARRYGTRKEHLIGVHTVPIICMERHHDKSEKHIVNDTILSEGQTCQEDIDSALDTLFNHDTLPPFFAKQMIQKLVTSNPSKSYIARVANQFVNNGYGVRGDMKAVIRAILLDEEARASAGTYLNFGKFKEPIIRASTFAKIFHVTANVEYPTKNPFPNGGQLFFRPPSVFNYFRPDYTIGSDLINENLVVPELEISDASNVTSINNGYHWMIFNANFAKNASATAKRLQNRYYINLSHELELAMHSTNELIEHLNLVLLNGTMSKEYKLSINSYIESLPIKPTYSKSRSTKMYRKRVTHAIYIIMSSSSQKYLY